MLGGTSCTVTGTASDASSGMQSVEVSMDGGSSWSFTNYSSGTWSYDWGFAANGEYLLKSRGTDNAGNVEIPGAGVSVTVFNKTLTNPELTHYDWDAWLTGGDCAVCHRTPSTFTHDSYRDEPGFCLSCHNPAAPAHERNITATRGHSTMANITSGTAMMPVYGNITSGEWDDRPKANLYNSDTVVCVTCHNPMRKTEDVGRDWEYTITSDNLTYSLQNGGWSGLGYYVPVVYRDNSLWTGPTHLKDRKAYLVDPSEYSYDESAGTVTFAQAQSPSDYVYVTLDYPYLRASSYANRLCSDCHAQTTHMGANCLVCHTAHNTDNTAGIRGTVRTTDRSERAVVFTGYTGPGSFADGDATYDGICEVCHTVTLYYRRDGSGYANHSGGVNYDGRNCTVCHGHAYGFTRQ